MIIEPFGPKTDLKYHESDIYKIHCDGSGCFFTLDTTNENGERVDLIIEFDELNGFRYLDEGDLMYYWDNASFRYYNVFKIIEGGWLTGEAIEKGVLTISKQLDLQEWLIVTTNGCINALSYNPPKVSLGPT
ncbi:MAG: hypothetical protein ABJK64_01365 [Paraglaciecola sp.]|uniref:hypothetical protein n=1 Tax=Paraglaciecola sp. TaxID=1920173 RepID=UPI0032974AE2